MDISISTSNSCQFLFRDKKVIFLFKLQLHNMIKYFFIEKTFSNSGIISNNFLFDVQNIRQKNIAKN
ncbi:hypothetical protein DFN06_001799 [Clostridium beijerinckii]|jgi:hypothetical protein|nr:hypothetical protein [Clostridium beijerinckii]NRT76814.1 hypothetical protein [Clostridium beijerinckii]NRZ26083.1 hypothetical protein [Clostridium beijerinckii]NYB98597.1 hypothetical protein [Clostridium beijerinckii]OOM23802.1 hypothetical protein CLBEI_24830 [Clostridium beijerinckii]